MFRLATIVAAIAALCACGSSHNNSPDAKPIDARPDAPPDGPSFPGGNAITLTSLSQLSYTAQVTIGGQDEQVILDTGSTTLGVASNTCTGCGVSPLYTPGASAVDQHMTGSAMYADGTGWTGEIYEDTVTLGSAAADDAQVKLVAIGSSSGFFRAIGSSSIGYQGILGLGPDGALLAGTTSFVTTVFAAGVPKEFAFQLCPDSGTMWLGGVDTAAEASAPAITPMVQTLPAYLVTVDDTAVGSGSAIGSGSDYGPTIIDTGTSISFIPPTPLGQVTAAIEASTGFQTVFNGQSLSSNGGCVTTTMTGAQIDAMLPPFHIAFADASGTGSTPYVDLPATKSYLVFEGTTNTESEWCLALEDSTQLTGGELTLSLFGDSMLNAFVAVFDVGHQQMEFAATKGCSEADAIARPTRRATPRVPGVPWWQQDPGVRLPRPEAIHAIVDQLRGAK